MITLEICRHLENTSLYEPKGEGGYLIYDVGK